MCRWGEVVMNESHQSRAQEHQPQCQESACSADGSVEIVSCVAEIETRTSRFGAFDASLEFSSCHCSAMRMKLHVL